MAVADLIADARSYASDTIGAATGALDGASSLVRAVGYTIPNFTPASLPGAPSGDLDLTVPTLDTINLELPSEPTSEPTFQDISQIDPGPVPTLVAQEPSLVMPTAPSATPAFNEVSPSINTAITFPEPPSELMNPVIEQPSITDRDEPDKPQVVLPVFSALAPTDNPQAPSDLPGEAQRAYREMAPTAIAMLDGQVDAMLARFNPGFHEQMRLLEARLSTYMEGGTGIAPTVEDAIYERSRSKNAAEARRTQEAAYDDAAARGFTLPSGALASAVRRARQGSADNNARASAEIAIKQAELEQQNVQFAITTSANLRTVVLNAAITYHQNLVAINGQALEYAKTILSTLIEAYNVAARVFTLKLDAYKAEAVVYETRLKSAMTGIELYQAEISALEAMTSVDRAKVDVYRARIESLRAYADVYQARIEAVQGRAGLERLKLDLFSSKVQAYSAQVSGKNAEWYAYTMAVNGETAKANVYRSQVDAYTARVQGYRATVETLSETVRAAALTNKSRAEQYTARLAGYTAVVQARGEKARTQLENQRQVITAFQAQAQAEVARAQVQNEYYRSVSYTAIKNAELQLSAQVQTAESTRSFGQSIAQLGVASAQVYSGLASAAMSGMNSLSAQTLAE